MKKDNFKKNFSLANCIKPFFTSLRLHTDESENYFFTYSNDKINVFCIETGRIVDSFPEIDDLEEDYIINFSVKNEYIVIAFKSGLIRLYKWCIEEDKFIYSLIKTWKSQHSGPITIIKFDPNEGNLIATGGSDGVIIIWDIKGQYITHYLKGCTGVISTISFELDPIDNHYYLCASGSHDNKLLIWDLNTKSLSKLVCKFEKHSSEITGTCFFKKQNGNLMLLSVSRDKIACVYDMINLNVIRTIPLYDSIASMVIDNNLPSLKDENDSYFVTVGEKGFINFWSVSTGKKLLENYIGDNLNQIIFLRKKNQFCIVTFENNVLIYSYDSNKFIQTKQLSGNNEEVLDLCYLGEKQDYILVATNSSNIKIFNLSTSNCLLIKNHVETVMSVKSFESNPFFFASCSKDKSFKIWYFDEDKLKVTCLFTGLGHNETVSCLGLPNLCTEWIITGSEDSTMKIWLTSLKKIQNLDFDDMKIERKLFSQTTIKAHDKGINCIDISPNDKLVATCSNDKLGKIFKLDYQCDNFTACSLEEIGVLKGHRRGIWFIKFSPVDQIIATSSSDQTVKIWSLSDLSCLKTLEGHQSPVLKVDFLTKGQQLISSCSNGNLKLWSLKNSDCLNTIDAHIDKIYCFIINKTEKQIITGSSDSEIKFWDDETETIKITENLKFVKNQEKSEVLRNLIFKKDWKKAICLSISLNQPFTTLNVLKELNLDLNEEERDTFLKKLFFNLREDQLLSIINYSTLWNTNQKHSFITQIVLNNLLKVIFSKFNLNNHENIKTLSNQDNLKKALQKLEPYTRKHYERYSRLSQSVTFFEFMYDNMKLSESLNI